jgi:hypothetical protein
MPRASLRSPRHDVLLGMRRYGNLTMSNGSAFFFPRRILRRLLLPLHTRLRLRFGRQIQPPEEGEWSADRRTLLLCRACEARRSALVIRGPSRCNRDALSALHRGDFRPETRAARSGSGTGGRQQLVRSRAMRPGGRGLEPPAVRFAPPPRDATPGSVCRSSPETSPPEPGWESCTINSLRSQQISSLRSRIRSQQPPARPPAITIPA